ncbi:MAG: HAD family hydrolase [Clostridia bacterium]|nr:HAD family hydrolase [Clostridia bacterium]
MKNINIYTDGACSGNQNKNNIGGWGCILEYGLHKKELHGGEFDTTNNRMELLALIAGFSVLKEKGLAVRVFSDSAYLIECFKKKWYEKWQLNGWKTSGKTPVENQDLWMSLLQEISNHHVTFFKIKGHLNLKAKEEILHANHKDFIKANGPFSFDDFIYVAKQNIRADELANEFINEARSKQDKAEVRGKTMHATEITANRPSILFDLDGTLWDSAKQVAESWNLALEKFPEIKLRFTTKMVRQSMGRVLEEIAEMWFPELPNEKRMELLKEMIDVELDYLKTHPGKLFPKTRKTLEELSKNYNLYIVSNCQVGYINGFFEGTKLKQYFVDSECAGNTGKPKADNIKLVVERNHLDRCLYIGDTQKDCDAADLAGMPFVHAAYGFGEINKIVPKVETFEDIIPFAKAFFG